MATQSIMRVRSGPARCCSVLDVLCACVCVSAMTNTSTLILFGKGLIPTLRLWMYSIVPQWVGLIDVVFSTLLLHTTPHPYHLSSTAQQQQQQQQRWLSSQTIRTVHITAHDRHKLSRPHRLTADSNVPGVLPGCQSSLCNVQQSRHVRHSQGW